MTALGLAGLLAILALQAARAWRYFPMFMGDQGWYLQVALRVSRGEVLYRDVAWAYGPLPAQALAVAFRWLGPDAGWATAINALLAALSLLLTYAALRSLLSPPWALAITAFAALAGPYVGGDLIRWHLYIYTQAVGWGTTASLAALVAALAWARSARVGWAALAGVAVGLAFLNKPEFGVIGAGATVAVLMAAFRVARSAIEDENAAARPPAPTAKSEPSERGTAAGGRKGGVASFECTSLRSGCWLVPATGRRGGGASFERASLRAGCWFVPATGLRGGYTWSAAAMAAAAAATVIVGFAAQAAQSGWGPLWRGYTGYDMLAAGRFWGAGLGDRRWLASVGCFWLTVAGIAAGLRWPRRRPLAFVAAALALVAAFVLIAPLVLASDPTASAIERGGLALGRLLQWLSAVPWAMLTPALIAAAVAGWRRSLPPAWWGLWAFALLANLRPLLTGYSSGLALAPGLAVLWWVMASHGDTENTESRPELLVGFVSWCLRVRPIRFWKRLKSPLRGAAPALLAVIAAASLLAQALTPNAAFSAPRRRLETAVGPVAVWDGPGAEGMAAVQAELRRRVPAGEPIFATGWGPGWYLLADRPNPTAFDVVLEGLGASGPEAADLQAALLSARPTAVLLPVEQWRPPPGPIRRSRDRDARAVRQGLARWWETLPRNYVEATPEGVTDWVLLVAVRE